VVWDVDFVANGFFAGIDEQRDISSQYRTSGWSKETEMDCFGSCDGETWHVSIENHKRNRRYRDSK